MALLVTDASTSSSAKYCLPSYNKILKRGNSQSGKSANTLESFNYA